MPHEAQLEWERRAGRPVAAAAFAGAALLLAGTIVRTSVVRQSEPNVERKFLLSVHEDSALFLLSSVLLALSFLALAAVVWFLFRATRYRREELPGWSIALLLLGPLLLAAAGLVSDFVRLDAADRFLESGPRSNQRADDLLGDGSVAGTALGSGGTLATAFALVLLNLNAMRAGLLSRFMGIIGIIVGALYVIPFFGGPVIVQVFWLAALGVLFLGFWPGGRGLAWERGEAVPWPSAAEKARAAREEPAAAASSQEAGETGETGPTRRSRKRKRRR